MESGLYILISLFVFLSIFGSILIILLLVYYPKINGNKINCQDANTSQLPDISDQPRVCNGKTITTDRLGISYTPEAILSTTPTAYKIACASMCTQVINGKCYDPSGNEISEYSTCLDKLSPKECIGDAIPVGYSGNVLYYVKRFTSGEYVNIEPCN